MLMPESSFFATGVTNVLSEHSYSSVPQKETCPSTQTVGTNTEYFPGQRHKNIQTFHLIRRNSKKIQVCRRLSHRSFGIQCTMVPLPPLQCFASSGNDTKTCESPPSDLDYVEEDVEDEEDVEEEEDVVEDDVEDDSKIMVNLDINLDPTDFNHSWTYGTIKGANDNLETHFRKYPKGSILPIHGNHKGLCLQVSHPIAENLPRVSTQQQRGGRSPSSPNAGTSLSSTGFSQTKPLHKLHHNTMGYSLNESLMVEARGKISETMLNLTLEVLFLLTGQDDIIVNKSSGEHLTPKNHPRASAEYGSTLNSITQPPPPTLMLETNNGQKILALAHKIIELLTGEVPVRCQDVAVYFSIEEWEYLEGHKDLYKGVTMESYQPRTLLDGSKSAAEIHPRPQRYSEENPAAMKYSQDEELIIVKFENMENEETVIGDQQCEDGDAPVTIHSGSSSSSHLTSSHDVIQLPDPSRRRRHKMTKTILNLTLKIIYLLTGEDYRVLKKTFEEILTPISHASMSGGCSRNQAAIAMPGPQLLLNDEENEQKILELANKLVHLLTGEVPLRCQGGTIYFTMKEWEYLKDCKDLYKDIMMETHQPLTSKGHEMAYSCADCGKLVTDGLQLVEHQKTHLEEKPYICSKCRQFFMHRQDLDRHQSIHREEKPFSCLECGKCFFQDSDLVEHERIHKVEKPFSCPECGILCTQLSDLVKHQELHLEEKPFSCSDCGKSFTLKMHLETHQKIHTHDKSFNCTECGKYFSKKSDLVVHQEFHTGEKPYSCAECGKCFSQKSDLSKHQRYHKGEKPFVCLDCRKRFSQKSDLVKHRRTHTGERPYSCLECGKRFTQKSVLIQHQRLHTGEKPFSCTECGKCFTHRSNYMKHKIIHTR